MTCGINHPLSQWIRFDLMNGKGSDSSGCVYIYLSLLSNVTVLIRFLSLTASSMKLISSSRSHHNRSSLAVLDRLRRGNEYQQRNVHYLRIPPVEGALWRSY